jgi:xanthine dehydrogenase large subunit
MRNIDAFQHVRGESVYVDDIPEINGTLYALPIFSAIAHAKLIKLDISAALEMEGVIGVLSAKDIPGENQIGGIIPDEPLFAEEEIHFRGQPVGLIVARTKRIARQARELVKMDLDPLEVVVDPRKAYEKGALLVSPRTFETGNVTEGFESCAYQFTGTVDSGAQEHLYIETQGSYAVPEEKGTIKIYSSTQGPSLVQRMTARVLDIPMHQVEVDVTRLGGAFGGKEDQATAWAVMAALAAHTLNRPVKLILDREDDIYVTGKRHPYSSDFRIGLDKDFRIVAFEVDYYQNGGASSDLSPAILERSLFHATNAYFIPNVKATAYSCRTNLTPFTAFRGFGAPQAMFVIESAIARAAFEIGIDSAVIQERNLIQQGDVFHYGQRCATDNAILSWNKLRNSFKGTDLKTERTNDLFVSIAKEVSHFNRANQFKKKGWAMMPVCFGISFTNTSMNQARALVHVYQDGSVSVSTGAIEMGQGVNTKLCAVAAAALGVDPHRVRIETTNTRRVANTSPTAASSGADLNGKATQIACMQIEKQLKQRAALELEAKIEDIEIREDQIFLNGNVTTLGWEELVKLTFLSRIQLSAVGHYATPTIFFDKRIEKGHPFAYHVFGTALTVVELDCLLGTYAVEKVQIVHDFGKSLNSLIDLGQLEGGVMQGIGWMTCEEVVYDDEGRLLSDSLSKYKVPDIYMAPSLLQTIALETEGEPMGILRSKAIGEPPFMYGIGTYFAIQKAISSFNPAYKPVFNAPFTPEKVLIGLYG